jgi:hypothetical protein
MMENTSHPLGALSEETMPIISNNNASQEENERKTSSECKWHDILQIKG